MVDLIPSKSIIILNIKNINTPVKWQRLIEWIKKETFQHAFHKRLYKDLESLKASVYAKDIPEK